MKLPFAHIIDPDTLWKWETGTDVDADKWNEGQFRDLKLRAQTDRIARRLEKAGILTRQRGSNTHLVCLMTGQSAKVPDYRNCNIFPVVQARNVSAMQRLVAFWFSQIRLDQLRMFIISDGLVKLPDYRRAHGAFKRRISRLASEPWLKDAGISFEYYSVEITVQRPNDEPLLHLHSHVLVRSRKRLGKKRWAELIERIRRHFSKRYVRDEPLRSPAECVKYVFKPADLEEKLTDAELAILFDQIFRLKFYQPLGDLAEYNRNLKWSNQKLRKAGPRGEELKWHRVQRKTRIKAEEEPPHLRDVLMTTEDPDSSNGVPEAPEPKENVILGVTAPIAKFSPTRTPCVIVKNFTGVASDLMHQERYQKLVEKAARFWDRNRAAEGGASMRHTTTTTVRERNTDVEVRPPP